MDKRLTEGICGAWIDALVTSVALLASVGMDEGRMEGASEDESPPSSIKKRL